MRRVAPIFTLPLAFGLFGCGTAGHNTAAGPPPPAARVDAASGSATMAAHDSAPVPVVTPVMDPARGPTEIPVIHLIATGGTISNTDDDGRLTGDQIVAGVPGLGEVVRVTVEQFSNIASGRMTPELWLRLARRVEAVFRERPGLAGVVITHGTDTMEETAYFLDLVLAEDRPVVVTGAMRNSSRLSSDGPANLYNAARYLVTPDSRGRGVMVVMDDVALPAREATKMNTIRVEAFEAAKRGPVAVLDPDAIVFLEPRVPRRPPVLRPDDVDTLSRVDILYTYAGAHGDLVDAAVAGGAAGLVLAAVGRGGLTPGQSEAVDRALDRGVYAAISSRTMTGRVPVGGDDRRLEDWSEGRGIRLGAGDLTPQKARILLMLALAVTSDPARVLEIFRTY